MSRSGDSGRPASLGSVSAPASAVSSPPAVVQLERLETRLPGHETLRPVTHFPVETAGLRIGDALTSGYYCRSTGTAYALVKEAEECNCGTVKVGARCVGDAAFEYRFPYEFAAIKVQDKARVLQQMSPDNVGDNTLLEKALLTTLRDEPHIIRLIECWHDRQNLYTVMEYGDSELTNYIASLPAAMMSEAEARHYFRHFLLGLQSIHRLGYCCRDLSSENAVILLEPRVLKIIDLGACKRMPVSEQGAFLAFPPGTTPFGKPSYMAPEYFAGREYVGTKIDIWACGCVLYTMVTGDLCFEFPSDEDPLFYRGEFTQKLLELNEERVATFGQPELSPELMGLLLWLLAIDPSRRPSSVDEILQHPWITMVDSPGDAAAASGSVTGGALGDDVDVDTG